MIYNILVAEPDKDHIKLLSDSLQQFDILRTLNLHFVLNKSDLEQTIPVFRPDIVILNTNLRFPSLEVFISRLVLCRPNVHIIIITNNSEISSLCQMPLHNVDGILSEPLDFHRLSTYIKSAIALLDQNLFLSSQRRYWRISGQIFLNHARIMNPENHLPVSMVNEMFGFRFKNDAYRMLAVNIDDYGILTDTPDEGTFIAILTACADILYQNIAPICYECVLRKSVKRIHMLINYPVKDDSALLVKVNECLKKYETTTVPNNYRISLCFSNLHHDIREIGLMSEESLDASWLRFQDRCSSIVFLHDPAVWPPALKEICSTLEQELKYACTILDVNLFKNTLNQFISIPEFYLSCAETRCMLRRVENYFFTINRPLIETMYDYKQIRQKVIKAIQLANSMSDYIKKYIDSLVSLFQMLSSKTDGNRSKHIRTAKKYILDHINSPLHLEDVAKVVELNPVYFSACFKKETGCNFSDYVNQCRIAQAKTILSSSTLNINEIAEQLGYANARYFSTIFKKLTGLRPTEYRDSLLREG